MTGSEDKKKNQDVKFSEAKAVIRDSEPAQQKWAVLKMDSQFGRILFGIPRASDYPEL